MGFVMPSAYSAAWMEFLALLKTSGLSGMGVDLAEIEFSWRHILQGLHYFRKQRNEDAKAEIHQFQVKKS